mmetsp:Transcript_47564/g.154385  ORF Transcript_47564/g.154385 Transcript_47564/m.154385 type:complete len:112 (-) Transcript_47564:709-1044(-)
MAMQMMTNQSYQEYWEGLIDTSAEGDAATLVREGIDNNNIVFLFPAGAGMKHTPLTGRADSDQLAANAEIAAQHAARARRGAHQDGRRRRPILRRLLRAGRWHPGRHLHRD